MQHGEIALLLVARVVVCTINYAALHWAQHMGLHYVVNVDWNYDYREIADVETHSTQGQRGGARPVYKRMGVPLTTVVLPLKTPLLS